MILKREAFGYQGRSFKCKGRNFSRNGGGGGGGERTISMYCLINCVLLNLACFSHIVMRKYIDGDQSPTDSAPGGCLDQWAEYQLW